MGKKFEQCGDAEATDYNHKAAMKSAQNGRTSESMETDYSIPGKKRSRKDFD